jgi:hypothetical protein
MQHDIRPGEIDCVFCWRTNMGEVGEGARETKYSGRPVRYQPDGRSMVEGLHTGVDGHACTHRAMGFRLSDQGGISRMCCFVAGFVTRPTLVPARTAGELAILRDAARGAVLSGDAHEWALGVIHAGERQWFAIHVEAPASVVASLARRVNAAWTLVIHEGSEKRPDEQGSRRNGARLRFLDVEGDVLDTRDGDCRFGEAPVPPIAAFETGPHHAREASIRDRLAYPDESQAVPARAADDEAATLTPSWRTCMTPQKARDPGCSSRVPSPRHSRS